MFTKMFMRYFPGAFATAFCVAIGVHLAAALLVAGALWGAPTPEAAPMLEKWVAVSDQTMMNGTTVTAHLRWVISPKGEWLIVPEAHRSRFTGIENGAELTLPASAPAWDRPYGRHTDWTHELQMGRTVTTRAEPGYRSAFEPTCFYVVSK